MGALCRKHQFEGKAFTIRRGDYAPLMRRVCSALQGALPFCDNANQTAFAIPYDAFLPKRSQLANVLVPVAASMSHVRQNAVRMEPTWMIMGHASGVAAAMAVRVHAGAVHNVSVPTLQRTLIEQGQMIWP